MMQKYQDDEENQAGAATIDPKEGNDNVEEEGKAVEEEEGKEGAVEENKYPPYFYDPDTNKLMTNPVVHPCGKSYQKSTLTLEVQEYCYPNRALQSYIEAELERRQLEGTMLGKMKQWDGRLREGLKQTIDKSALPSREYRPLPDYYYCPITYELIKEPVIDSDGHTYEYEAIVQWIRKNGTSPVTRKPLQINKLYDNLALEQILNHESNKANEDSIHPSVRRWKEQLANKTQQRSIRDHVVEEAAADTTTTTNNNTTTTANRHGQLPTTPEELDERQQQYNSCACTTFSCVGFLLAFVLMVLFVPAFGFSFTLFVIIVCCSCCCSKSNDDDNNNVYHH